MVRDKYMHAKARMLDPLQTLQPNFCWRSKNGIAFVKLASAVELSSISLWHQGGEDVPRAPATVVVYRAWPADSRAVSLARDCEGVAMVKRELVGEASFEGGAAQLTLPVQPVQSNVEFLAIEIATAP